MQLLTGVLASLASLVALAGMVRAADLAGGVGGAGGGPIVPVVDAKGVSPVATASNQFMGDLYGQLGATKGNLFFSPYSISTALALLNHGARGNTAAEISTTLHLPPENAVLDAAFTQLIGKLQTQDAKQGFQLSVANALWTQKGDEKGQGEILPAYLNDAAKIFWAKAEGVDFQHASEAARTTINQWVARQTNDKIPDLMPKDSITPRTVLVITNAVYFKGEWANKFNKQATVLGDFHTAPLLTPVVGAGAGVGGIAAPGTVKAELMHQTHGFRFTADDQCQALELPYKSGELAMLVLLPTPADADGAKLEASLSANYVRGLISQLAQQQVNVTLPKWKVTLTYDLIPPLKKLGIKDAFTGAADFSGINGRQDLVVGAVVHKAFIEVNEEFTEAAGATGISMMRSAMPHQPDRIVEFKADRPFVYLIYHRPSQTVLFAGRLADPTAK